jgi:hypothetical protein
VQELDIFSHIDKLKQQVSGEAEASLPDFESMFSQE